MYEEVNPLYVTFIISWFLLLGYCLWGSSRPYRLLLKWWEKIFIGGARQRW
jgi:hypothetical protein